MSKTYAIILDDNGALKDFEQLAPAIKRSAVRAVNKAAEWSRAKSAKEVRQQLNFPASYLSPSEGRLVVKNKANASNPEATVSARVRATSLARFDSGARAGKRGAMIQIKPGIAKFMRNAVFIKLNSGSNIDSTHNLGLAVRTKNGQRPKTAYRPVRMKNGMWLLYGPSVSQALLSARDSGIWPDMADETIDKMIEEFNRQMEL